MKNWLSKLFKNTEFTRHDLQSGSVLVIAVIMTFVMSSVAISLGNFALRDVELAGSNTASTKALYAADTALECALYHDLVLNSFFENQASQTSFNTNCDSDAGSAVYSSSNCMASSSWCYNFETQISNNNGSFKVVVQYNYFNVSDSVTIVSNGYSTASIQNRSNQRRLVYTYNL